MDERQVADLIKKYNEGTLGSDERLAVDMWYLKYASESKAELTKEDESLLSARLKSALPLKHQPVVAKLWPRLAIAVAVATVILSAGIWFFMSGPLSRTAINYANDVLPGKTGATLTLANGKKIYISDADTGRIANESGVLISKSADGQIVYEITAATDQAQTGMNTLETSNGQQAQVKLPDGSVVHLNAASVLRYPFSFAKLDKRKVEFSGEGFFEVEKDASHPFLVKSQGQEIEVLGTHFNISAYPSDLSIKTTLIEGSVKISNEKMESRILKPGQQATVGAGTLAVATVETEYAIAWNKGYFMFDNESLEDIMQKLARWYNIVPEYNDPALKSRVFFGSISKFENISKVLSIMERTNVARFDIRDKKVIISKN